MRRASLLVGLGLLLGAWDFGNRCPWENWGQSSSHDGSSCVVAQPANRTLAEVQFDPFVEQEMAESGGFLLTHYQAPLNDDQDHVIMMQKAGTYVSCDPPGSFEPFPFCGPFAFDQQIWQEKAFRWVHGQLREIWTFLDLNDGAAYTPLSLDDKGRIYTLNTGVLTVLGR